jgi:hypothetical protein
LLRNHADAVPTMPDPRTITFMQISVSQYRNFRKELPERVFNRGAFSFKLQRMAPVDV